MACEQGWTNSVNDWNSFEQVSTQLSFDDFRELSHALASRVPHIVTYR